MAVVSKASEELKEIRKKNMEDVFEYRKYLYDHPKLYHLFLEVTSRCNARCEHCGSSCGYEKPKNEVSKEKLMETAMAFATKVYEELLKKYNVEVYNEETYVALLK